MRSWAPGSHEFWVEPWSERGEPERGWRPSAGIERLPLLANSRNRRVFPCICVSLCHEECHRCVSECQWKYRRGVPRGLAPAAQSRLPGSAGAPGTSSLPGRESALSHLPGWTWGHVLRWGGRQAGSRAGAQQGSRLPRLEGLEKLSRQPRLGWKSCSPPSWGHKAGGRRLGGGREHDPGEGRASFGAGGPGARSLGRGFLALSPCSLLPPSSLPPPPSSPSPAPVLQIAGRLNSLRASRVDSELGTPGGREGGRDSGPHSHHGLTPCGPERSLGIGAARSPGRLPGAGGQTPQNLAPESCVIRSILLPDLNCLPSRHRSPPRPSLHSLIPVPPPPGPTGRYTVSAGDRRLRRTRKSGFRGCPTFSVPPARPSAGDRSPGAPRLRGAPSPSAETAPPRRRECQPPTAPAGTRARGSGNPDVASTLAPLAWAPPPPPSDRPSDSMNDSA
uniref:basic proline-rich protein-like n=1 Tax=Nyctereutes procyonoides TaxID=34880 RepID=UPI002443EAF9|nr:basic proline-rich protein-like [Nyctereutes procyonoides]